MEDVTPMELLAGLTAVGSCVAAIASCVAAGRAANAAQLANEIAERSEAAQARLVTQRRATIGLQLERRTRVLLSLLTLARKHREKPMEGIPRGAVTREALALYHDRTQDLIASSDLHLLGSEVAARFTDLDVFIQGMLRTSASESSRNRAGIDVLLIRDPTFDVLVGIACSLAKLIADHPSVAARPMPTVEEVLGTKSE